MREHDGKGARVEAMGDSIDSPTAGLNTLTPASVTPDHVSPLPWKADIDRARHSAGCITDAAGNCAVCFGHDYDDYGSVHIPDAEYIVRAANAFPDLLAALKALKGSSCFCPYGIGHPSYSWHSDACINATVAIAKAEASHD